MTDSDRLFLAWVTTAAGLLLFPFGVWMWLTGAFEYYPAGSYWWVYTAILLGAAGLTTAASVARWIVSHDWGGSWRSPMWTRAALVIPGGLILGGMILYLTGPACLSLPGIMAPPYCPGYATEQQAQGALALLLGCLAVPAVVYLLFLTRRFRLLSRLPPAHVV